LLVLAALVGALMSIPSTAEAAVDGSYSGIATTDPGGTSTFYVTAWRWYDSYGWVRTYRLRDQRVWAQPFANVWSWTWSPRDGWLAIESRYLDAQDQQVGPDLSGGGPVSVQLGADRETVAGTAYISKQCDDGSCTDLVRQTRVRLTFHCDDGSTYCSAARSVTTDDAGGYSIRLRPGSYTVTMDVSGTDSPELEVDAGGSWDSGLVFNQS
jgi:hypothetical protein